MKPSNRIQEVEVILDNAQGYLKDIERKLFILDNLRSKLLDVIETAVCEHQALLTIQNGQRDKTESAVDEFEALFDKYSLEGDIK